MTERLTPLQLVPQPRTITLRWRNPPYDAFNVPAVQGLVWAASLLPADPALAGAIGALVEPALVKVGGFRARSMKLAGATVFGLGRIRGDHAAAELERLEGLVRHGAVLKQIKGVRARSLYRISGRRRH